MIRGLRLAKLSSRLTDDGGRRVSRAIKIVLGARYAGIDIVTSIGLIIVVLRRATEQFNKQHKRYDVLRTKYFVSAYM